MRIVRSRGGNSKPFDLPYPIIELSGAGSCPWHLDAASVHRHTMPDVEERRGQGAFQELPVPQKNVGAAWEGQRGTAGFDRGEWADEN